MTGLARIAAVGDVHMDADVLGVFRPALDRLPEVADVLLLAGDLTRHGTPAEARCVATEFGGLGVPVIAVLGNHDYHSDREADVMAILRDAGIVVLDGTSHRLDVDGVEVAVAGLAGFGGGFAGRCVSMFGEKETKAFAGYGRKQAERLRDALAGAGGDVRVALIHYSPVPETLVGEPLEIYPFLGSYLLGEAIDETGCALALHGHAHAGSPTGTTPGGVPVRNVAHPVIRQAYGVFAVRPVDRTVLRPAG
jgi:Icc-related predicted phosphoesterase